MLGKSGLPRNNPVISFGDKLGIPLLKMEFYVTIFLMIFTVLKVVVVLMLIHVFSLTLLPFLDIIGNNSISKKCPKNVGLSLLTSPFL